MDELKFNFQTGSIKIDYTKCKTCNSFGCVKACSLFGRNLFRIEDGKPVLVCPPEEARRLCNECLACEFYCKQFGKNALEIYLDMFGIDNSRPASEGGK